MPDLEIDQLVAVKHPADRGGVWNIVPAEYWRKHACVPDCSVVIEVPGFDEILPYRYAVRNPVSDGRPELQAAGIVIDENPQWYFTSL